MSLQCNQIAALPWPWSESSRGSAGIQKTVM